MQAASSLSASRSLVSYSPTSDAQTADSMSSSVGTRNSESRSKLAGVIARVHSHADRIECEVGVVDDGGGQVRALHRFSYKILSRVFNFDNVEVAANPVHLLYVLEQQMRKRTVSSRTGTKIHGFCKRISGTKIR